MKLIEQLRERKVIKTTSIYLGAAWMVIGAADIFFPMLGINPDLLATLIWIMVAGIPVVIILSWFVQVGSDEPAEPNLAAARPRSAGDLVLITLLIGALGGSIYFHLQDESLLESTVPLVAVMPFDDLSEVGGHVAYGLADELINLLVREPQMRLVTFDVATTLAAKGLDVLTAARDLNADFVVRGSVRVQGDELRVNVRVIDVATGQVTWSDQSTGSIRDVFLSQHLLAQRLTESLNIAIEYAYSSTEGQLSAAAVDGYLQATQLIREHGSLDKYQQALRQLDSVLLIEPDFVAASGRACSVHMTIFSRTEDPADYRTGEEACRTALELDPDAVHVQLAQASLKHFGGEYAEAEALTREIIKHYPNLEAAYSQLGSSTWRQGKLAEAEAAYHHAIALQDRNWGPYLSLGNFLALNQRYEEALVPFTRITELNPEDFVGWASLGVTHYEAGNYTQAVQFLQQSLKLNQNSRAYFNLGLTYAALKQDAEALSAFQQSVDLNPQNYRALMFVATHAGKQGQTERARQATQEALAIVRDLIVINPNNAYVRANGAVLLADLNLAAEAVEWAERARVDNVADPKVQLDIGLVYYKLGERERGIDELVGALQMGYPRELFMNVGIDTAVLQHPKIQAALLQ